MGLRERILVHVFHQSNLVFTADCAQVNWQTAAAPNKLEVVSFFSFSEAFEDAPKSENNLVICAAVGVGGDRLQSLDRDNLITSAPAFKSLPVAEVQDLLLVLNNGQETQADSFNLLFGFIGADLEHLITELVDVALCNLDGFAIGAKWNFQTR